MKVGESVFTHGYDYIHSAHRRARAGAFARSSGVCQLCGGEQATVGHHWARVYPKEVDMKADDLTALCDICDLAGTSIRRMKKYGASRKQIVSQIRKMIEECDFKSPSSERARSFNTALEEWMKTIRL